MLKKNSKRKYRVKVNSYAGGKMIGLLKKCGGDVYDFSCRGGVIEFAVLGVAKSDIEGAVRKCGGDGLDICDISDGAKFASKIPQIVGVVVFCAVILLSNMFVFNVKVSGVGEAEGVHISNVAREVFPFGSFKSEEKLAELVALLDSDKNIAFHTEKIYQNTLHINFLKAETATVIEGEKNFVAPENGVIVSLSTLLGSPQKVAGDEVCKGDVLITAVTGGETPEGTRSAEGSCVMEVCKSESYAFPISQTQKAYTGEVQKIMYFEVGEHEVFKGDVKFDCYAERSKTVEFLTPNIRIVKCEYAEVLQREVVYSEGELEEIAVEIFQSGNLPAFAHTIINMETDSKMEDGVCKIDVFCEYLLLFSS